MFSACVKKNNPPPQLVPFLLITRRTIIIYSFNYPVPLLFLPK